MKGETFAYSPRKSACCSSRKTDFCWGLLVTKHMQVLRNNEPSRPLVKFVAHTLCLSVWPERTQMEAHSVLAAPHNCSEMFSSFTATERAEPSTVGSLLSTQWLPSNTSHRDQVCRLKSVFISLYIDWEVFVQHACVCACAAAEDLPLRCVCCSWCCESGRWQTPPITRLFHNTRVAPYHCRRDEEPQLVNAYLL